MAFVLPTHLIETRLASREISDADRAELERRAEAARKWFIPKRCHCIRSECEPVKPKF